MTEHEFLRLCLWLAKREPSVDARCFWASFYCHLLAYARA